MYVCASGKRMSKLSGLSAFAFSSSSCAALYCLLVASTTPSCVWNSALLFCCAENVLARCNASALWFASKALGTASIYRAGSVGAAAADFCAAEDCVAWRGVARSAHVSVAKIATMSAIVLAWRIRSLPRHSVMKNNLKRKLFRWGGTRGISQDQFCWNLVFPAMRFRRRRKFVQRVGRHLPKHVAMHVNGSDGWIAVFGEARVVETGDRNVFRDAQAGFQQPFQYADGGEVVHRHDRGGPRRKFCDRSARGQAAFKAEIAREDGARLQMQVAHAGLVRFQARDVGFQLRAAGDKCDAAMSHLVQILDDLLHPGKIIDAEFADVTPRGGKVQKCDRDASAREFLYEASTYFRGHDGAAAHIVFHHALGSLLRAPRIVVGIAQDRVVSQLARARLEPFDHFREKRIDDVRNDNPQRPAIPRRQMARVGVGKIAKFFDRRENDVMRMAADFSRLIQHVGNSRGGYAGGLGDIANGKGHRG